MFPGVAPRCAVLCCADDSSHATAGPSHHSPAHAGRDSRQSPNRSTQSAQAPSQANADTAADQQIRSSQQPDADSTLTPPQDAAQSLEDESSTTPRVPPELRAITAYLRDKERLKTPGLFVNSADAAMLWAMHQPPDLATSDSSKEPKSGCALAVKQIREALDRGQEVELPLQALSFHQKPCIFDQIFASLPCMHMF